MNKLQKRDRDLHIFCSNVQFILTKTDNTANLAVHCAHMTNCLNDVPGTCLAFGPDHCCTFGNTAKSLAEIAGTADKRNIELGFIYVVEVISR